MRSDLLSEVCPWGCRLLRGGLVCAAFCLWVVCLWVVCL